MKPNEVRNLTTAELEDAITSRRVKIQELRFSAAIGQNSDVREIRRSRREIARLMTIAREKAES